MRTRVRLAGLSAVLAVVVVAIPQVALANWFNGGVRSGYNNGAIQTIEVSNPTVVSGGFSCAWVMTHNTAYGATAAYAQTGWDKKPSFSSPRYFREYSDIYGNAYYNSYSTPSVGSSHLMEVYGDATTWYFAYDDTYSLGSVSKSSLGWGTTSNPSDDAEYEAETHQLSDTCAGSSGNPNAFSGAQYKDSSGYWHTASPTVSKNKTQFGWRWVNQPNSWETWDSRN